MAFLYLPKQCPSQYSAGERPRLQAISRVSGRNFEMPRMLHQHDDRLEILFIENGRARHVIDSAVYALEPGDLVIYNAGVLHEEYLQATTDLLVYTLDIQNVRFHGLPPNCLNDGSGSPVIKTGVHRELVRAWVANIYDQVLSETDGGFDVANLMTQSLLVWVKNGDLADRPADVVKAAANGMRIKAWIDQRFREAIGLQDIAEALHFNTCYVSHVLKTYTGYSPMQYINRRRIGEAQSLLIDTGRNMTEIAELVGFGNVSMFSRAFRQVVGCSPSDYRKKWQI